MEGGGLTVLWNGMDWKMEWGCCSRWVMACHRFFGVLWSEEIRMIDVYGSLALTDQLILSSAVSEGILLGSKS